LAHGECIKRILLYTILLKTSANKKFSGKTDYLIVSNTILCVTFRSV